jgi:hypothetical protein
MKKTITAIAVLLAVAGTAYAQQDLSAQSSAQSGSQAGAQSGSVAAGNVVVFNPGTAGATATGAGGIPTTRVINERSGTDRTESVLSGTTTSNQNLSATTRAEQILSGSTTSNENVRYSGQIDNHTSGGTYDISTQNVNYSGTQTIKNVPGIAMSGPASGPCTGVSGGISAAGPGFGIGLNGSSVMADCRLRENTRVIGMAMQSLDGAANPQEKGEITVMFMDAVRNLAAYNDKIAADEKLPPKKAK